MPRTATKEDVLARVRALVPGIGARVAAAEEARTLPPKSISELMDAGIARILMPPRYGGYGLGIDTWFEVVREISTADASHGWCASLIIHHPHMVAQFPEEAQQAVWADGPDVAIAASVLPTPGSPATATVFASPATSLRSPAASTIAPG